MKRRVFLKRTGSFTVLCFAGCGAQIAPSDPPPDIFLEGDENALSEKLSKSFRMIADVAEGKRKNARVGFEDESGKEHVVSFALVSGAGVAYAHPLVEAEDRAEPAHLVLATKNLLPSVALVDGSGETLKQGGKELEFGFDVGDLVSSLRAAPQAMREEIKGKLISTVVKAAAVIFALWLGLAVAKSIVGGLAFIAVVVLLLGVLAAALGVLDETLAWVFEKTGLSVVDVQQFFEKAPDKIADVLRGVADFVEEKL